jgi:hypothetical protein
VRTDEKGVEVLNVTRRKEAVNSFMLDFFFLKIGQQQIRQARVRH